jgi:hypothetical protein
VAKERNFLKKGRKKKKKRGRAKLLAVWSVGVALAFTAPYSL